MSYDQRRAGASRREKELNVAWQRTNALLAEYEADNNEEGVSEAISQLALLRAEASALVELQNEDIQRNSYQPIEQSPEEWRVKPAEKMTGDDGLAVVNYGKKPGDPTWVSNEEYNRQVGILRQKKSHGEYT